MKVFQNAKVSQNREICESKFREINVSLKFTAYYSDNTFGTLITGSLIGGGHLMDGHLIGV